MSRGSPTFDWDIVFHLGILYRQVIVKRSVIFLSCIEDVRMWFLLAFMYIKWFWVFEILVMQNIRQI